MERNIAAVVPVYNPERGLQELCRSLCDLFGVVVVVDDGSVENVDEFSRLPLTCEIIRHTRNRGKGRAIKSAIGYVRQRHPEVVAIVFCDGDGQHSPCDVEKIAVHTIKTGRVTLGVRDFTGKVPFRSRFGNILTSFFVRLIFHFPICDTQTGLRAIPSRLFNSFETLHGDRYEYEMRQFGLMKSLGEFFEQIPIKTIYIEANRASHFRPVIDSIRVYRSLFGGTVTRFCASSVLSFLVDNLVFTAVLFFLMSFGWARRYDILASLIVSRVVSATLNYLVNRIVVFKSLVPFGLSFVRYWVLVLLIGLMSYALTALISALFDAEGWTITLIKIFVETVLFVVSYKCQKKWVFQTECGR